MKKILKSTLVKIVNRSVKAEVGAVCGFIGYQPTMPEKAKEFKYEKNRNEKII